MGKSMGDGIGLSPQERLLLSAKRGDLQGVMDSINEGASPLEGNSAALRWSAAFGHIDCLEYLIPVSNPRAIDSMALQWAAKHGHPRCVEALLAVSNPCADGSWALLWALMNGHAECIRLLLPVSKPANGSFKVLEAVMDPDGGSATGGIEGPFLSPRT